MLFRPWMVLHLAAVIASAGCQSRRAVPPAPAVPAEVRGEPGRLILLTVQSPTPVLRWHLCGESGAADLWPSSDGKRLAFVAPRPGRYVLLAWSARGDRPSEAATCIIRLEAPEPPPPADPLLAVLRAAWQQETGADRQRERETLARFYHRAAERSMTAPGASVESLYQSLKTELRSLLNDAALPQLRAAIASDFRSTLPTDPAAALDPAVRETCRRQFDRVAKLLESL